MAATYTPEPIDTDEVELPPELTALTEQLAQHIHDLWAAERIAQGWNYGERRDDERRLHPCLVPYDELPESEKTFDRATAIGTLRAIKALGYTVNPPEGLASYD